MGENDARRTSSEEDSNVDSHTAGDQGADSSVNRRTTLRTIAAGAGLIYGVGTVAATPSDQPEPTEENTVDYSALSQPARKAFNAAKGSPRPSFFGPSSKYISQQTFNESGINSLRDHRFVRKNGQLFEFELYRTRLIASYGVYATQTEPNSDRTVTPLSEVHGSRKGAVRQAIETGSFHAAPGRWRTMSEVRKLDLVEANGETYELMIVSGDQWLTALSVTPS